jgi:hypothetical protein
MELDGVGAGVRRGVHEGQRAREIAVVIRRDLGDHQGGRAFSDGAISQ